MKSLVLLKPDRTVKGVKVSDQRAHQGHVTGGHFVVETKQEVQTNALLPPHVIQKSLHLPMPSFNCVELAVQFESQKGGLVCALALGAVGVHNESQ
jgi:hypothetical protein